MILFIISGKNPRDYFDYLSLDPVYRYFYEDGTKISAYKSPDKFATGPGTSERDYDFGNT